MTLRYLLENGNLIANHAFSACHEALADDFASIVLSSVDVHTFFHDCIEATRQAAK